MSFLTYPDTLFYTFKTISQDILFAETANFDMVSLIFYVFAVLMGQDTFEGALWRFNQIHFAK